MAPKVQNYLRFAGGVKRYHSWPVLQTQTNAEHTWNVLRIFIAIFGAPSPNVTVRIVHHDSAELLTGDPPFPIKRDHPELKRIYDALEHKFEETSGILYGDVSREDALRIKVCDLIEMWEFGLVETNMGNRFAELIVIRTEENVIQLSQSLPSAEKDEVLAYMHNVKEKLR